MNDKLNFCRPDIMSICTAPDPKNCKHYKPSTIHSRCMFQNLELSNGYHCGCSDAQCEARCCERELEDALELIEEGKEGDMPT